MKAKVTCKECGEKFTISQNSIMRGWYTIDSAEDCLAKSNANKMHLLITSYSCSKCGAIMLAQVDDKSTLSMIRSIKAVTKELYELRKQGAMDERLMKLAVKMKNLNKKVNKKRADILMRNKGTNARSCSAGENKTMVMPSDVYPYVVESEEY